MFGFVSILLAHMYTVAYTPSVTGLGFNAENHIIIGTVKLWIIEKRIELEDKAKGRRLCLGGKICSISCRASCFASVDLEKLDEFDLFF